MKSARYGLDELEAVIGWPTESELSEALGVSPVAIGGWKARGLSHAQADALACAFGLHPVLIWPHWLDAETFPNGTDTRPARRRRRPGYGPASERTFGRRTPPRPLVSA